MPGISALFKVIYLGRKPGYSILLRHEEITKFSRKSTLRARISGAARRRQSFSPQEPGENDNDRKHQMRRQANSSRRRANTQKVCNGGELQREIRFPPCGSREESLALRRCSTPHPPTTRLLTSSTSRPRFPSSSPLPSFPSVSSSLLSSSVFSCFAAQRGAEPRIPRASCHVKTLIPAKFHTQRLHLCLS